MAIGNVCRKFGEIATCGFWDMQADRQTNRHTDHNTLYTYWQRCDKALFWQKLERLTSRSNRRRRQQTDKQTDTLITILCTPTGSNVIKHCSDRSQKDSRRVRTGGDVNASRKTSAESDVYPLSATHLYQPIRALHLVSATPRNTSEPSLRTESLSLPAVFTCVTLPLVSRYHVTIGRVLGSDEATHRRIRSRVNNSKGLTVVFCGGSSSHVRPTTTTTTSTSLGTDLYPHATRYSTNGASVKFTSAHLYAIKAAWPARSPILGFWGSKVDKNGRFPALDDDKSRAKFDAASFILGKQIHDRTYTHKNTKNKQ